MVTAWGHFQSDLTVLVKWELWWLLRAPQAVVTVVVGVLLGVVTQAVTFLLGSDRLPAEVPFSKSLCHSECFLAAASVMLLGKSAGGIE